MGANSSDPRAEIGVFERSIMSDGRDLQSAGCLSGLDDHTPPPDFVGCPQHSVVYLVLPLCGCSQLCKLISLAVWRDVVIMGNI